MTEGEAVRMTEGETDGEPGVPATGRTGGGQAASDAGAGVPGGHRGAPRTGRGGEWW
ncbi:hypothetical protein ACFV20_33050 [Streptomyces sp. NPDC059696]|uniref:hypothetical protein n=1 Tax=Streptomyces sp. NPDC059696 TaxID=3346911 RepID=UPI0036CDA42F